MPEKSPEQTEKAAEWMHPAGALISASSDNVYCELDGESVILNMADGVYYGLNVVGHRIWEMIQTPSRLDAIVAQLLEEFEVEADACEADVRELLAELEQKGLLKVDDSATA